MTLRPLGDPLPDVDQLDLVGIDDVDVGFSGGERVDGNAAAFGLSQVGGEPVAHLDGQHFGEVPSFRRPGQLFVGRAIL